MIEPTPGEGGINTAYTEQLNATFRARLSHWVRRSRALARRVPTLTQGMYLVGTVYNFCTFQRSLRIRRRGRTDRASHRWPLQTPDMAAGLTDHRLSRHELLALHVAPPPWMPPKRRGRWSNATHALVARWCASPRLAGGLPRRASFNPRPIPRQPSAHELFISFRRPRQGLLQAPTQTGL
jgi:hypothetical protein